jgi:hypothetical protein
MCAVVSGMSVVPHGGSMEDDLSPCLCLCICLSLHLPLPVSASASASASACLCLCICLSLSLPLPLHLPVSASASACLCLCVCRPVPVRVCNPTYTRRDITLGCSCAPRGARCRVDIPAGAFVCEYIGDVVTDAMGIVRGMHYDNDMGRSYLFDLDFFGSSRRDHVPLLAIDGSRRGNVCRFINHVRANELPCCVTDVSCVCVCVCVVVWLFLVVAVRACADCNLFVLLRHSPATPTFGSRLCLTIGTVSSCTVSACSHRS